MNSQHICGRVHNCILCDIVIWLIGFTPRLTGSRCLALQKRIKKTNCVWFHLKLLLTVSVNVHENILQPILLCFLWKLWKRIFSWILGQGTALVECTLETKPLEQNADYAVSLKVEPVEVIFDSVSSSVSAIFCSFTSAFCGFASCMKCKTRCNADLYQLDHFLYSQYWTGEYHWKEINVF